MTERKGLPALWGTLYQRLELREGEQTRNILLGGGHRSRRVGRETDERLPTNLRCLLSWSLRETDIIYQLWIGNDHNNHNRFWTIISRTSFTVYIGVGVSCAVEQACNIRSEW
jgi:hypothetical protein